MALIKDKTKLAKEAALAEFKMIVKYFGFNVSEESTSRVIKMELNNVPSEIKQEIYDSASIVEKIMQGVVFFDQEKKEIVYKLEREISTGENGSVKTREFRFGEFTRAKQKACKVPLNHCNFSTLDDEKQDILLGALVGVSDPEIFSALSIPQFNDLRMIGSYFFN